MTDFEKVMDPPIDAQAARVQHPLGPAGETSPTQSRYWLTAKGDLEEEERRRSYPERVLAGLIHPNRVVALLLALISGTLVVIVGLLLRGQQ